MQQLIALFGTTQIKWIVILIVVDIILGIIAALLKKDFKLGKLAGFMKKGIVGYVLGFAVLEMVAQALPSMAWVAMIGFILVTLALVGSILSNLGKMGLPIPTLLKKD